MHISFSPQRSDENLKIVKTGDVLKINRKSFDFSSLPPGATLPADAVDCSFIAGPVYRDMDGQLSINLRLPYGIDPSPEQLFPADIVDPPDGLIDLPHAAEANNA